jgi:3-deoxy-D-manno-octulosonic-acid transferase
VIRKFPGALRYSQYTTDSAPEARVLILDNIGMLSNVYRYGHIAWVGGAFGKGLHSILEPIAFGLPVLFGPRYHNFREAVELVENGGAQVLRSHKDLQSVWCRWQDTSGYQRASEAALQYIERQKGATAAILQSLDPFFA